MKTARTPIHRSLTGALALACLALLCGMMACTEPRQPMAVGNALPTFALKNLEGETITHDRLAGKPLVLNFWATWCSPCLKEIPDLKAVAAESEVQVVGIALDEEGRRAVAPFVEAHGIPYPILLGNQEVFRRFDGFGIPYTLVVDAQQRVAKIYRGVTDLESLRADLQRLAESP